MWEHVTAIRAGREEEEEGGTNGESNVGACDYHM